MLQLLQADVLLGKICCFEMTVSSEFIVPLPLQMAVILKGAQPPNNIVTIERFAEVVLTPKGIYYTVKRDVKTLFIHIFYTPGYNWKLPWKHLTFGAQPSKLSMAIAM